jgi:hypothetical protein
MASFALTDVELTVNSVDLSAYLTNATLHVEAEALEDTAMGDLWRSRIAGLKDFNLELEFNQDFAASAVDATLWAAFGTVVAIAIRPTSSAIATTNPEFQGNVLINDYPPIGGKVGELAKASVKWPGSGTLTRDTTP